MVKQNAVMSTWVVLTPYQGSEIKGEALTLTHKNCVNTLIFTIQKFMYSKYHTIIVPQIAFLKMQKYCTKKHCQIICKHEF